MIDKDVLFDLYYTQGKTYSEIGEVLDCATSTVGLSFKHHGFKLRKRTPWNSGLTAKDDSRLATASNGKHVGCKGLHPWNFGLTKETNSTIANIAKVKEDWHSQHDSSGVNNPFYGKKHTEEFCKRQSLNKGGNGNPSRKYVGFTAPLKNIIRTRDGNKCQLCPRTQEQNFAEFKCKLDVHHIDYTKSNCEEINLIALCKYCHTFTNTNRRYWKARLQKYQLERPI